MCDRQRLALLYVIVNLSKRCDLQHSLMTAAGVSAGLHYLIADRVLPSSERVVDSIEAGAEQIESNSLERIAVSRKEEA